jgi:phage terminase large subunit-like protein
MMSDPVTQYARRVGAGEEIASALVRKACARHLADLEHGSRRGLEWRPAAAGRAIDFFADVLFLPEYTDATEDVAASSSSEPRPFVLAPWQAFIVGSLFGWYTSGGFRRFREAYIETSKGAGKTPLGAGIMLYLLVADGERGAQVFLAAVTKDQAGYAWRDCRAMVQASPELYALFGEDGFLANELRVTEDGSFLRPVSSEKRGLDGKRVHGALVDELHEHATPIVVNKMRAGTKGRRNALIVKTTNSGFDRTSVCWQHHEYSRRVLDGSITNDTWFAFICGLDPCQACATKGLWFPQEDCPHCDDWKTEGPHWLKANPNLGVSLPWQYVRERVSQAIGMTSQISDVLRFNFCVWTQVHSHFLDVARWQLCEGAVTEAELAGARCFAGLDLGQSDDFTAFVLVWMLQDGRIAIRPRFWIPSSALEKPGRPYQDWQRAGALVVVPESEIVDLNQVQAEVQALCLEHGVIECAYDKRFAEQMSQSLTAAGIMMVNTAQGFQLTEALRKLSDLVTNETLIHDGNPVMTWMAGTLVVKHGPNRTMRPDKDKATEKIDGTVALVMALDIIVRQPADGDVSADDLVMVL